MPWSTAISVGGSLLGGALGGGNKSAERAMKDQAARAQVAQANARQVAQAALAPYTDSGSSANTRLSYLLGTGGYDVARPQLQTFIDKGRDEHWKITGKDFARNTNVQAYAVKAQKEYEQALQEWEKGFEQFRKSQGGKDAEFGSLNRNFTNEDFVKDPGYQFRLEEGERGINRALSARGGFDSGSALKALARYNQDYGSNEFGNAYNRDAANKSRTFSQLMGMSNQGMSAASSLAGVSQNAANNIGNIGMQTAQQVGQMQQDRNMTYANAIQGAIGNLVYGMNRPRDSGVTSNNPWATPPFNGGYNQSAGNNWWNNQA